MILLDFALSDRFVIKFCIAMASDEVEARFLSYWRATISGFSDYSASLRSRTEFSNPYILDRAVTRLSVDESGSNFAPPSRRALVHEETSIVALDSYRALREEQDASMQADAAYPR